MTHPITSLSRNQTIRSVTALRSTDYTARLALDPATRQDAFRLRYASYLASGYILANETGLFEDEYDALPNCKTMVIYSEGMPAASVRTCRLADGTCQRSPAADTFPDEVQALLRQQASLSLGGRGIETTRLVRSPAAENNQGLVFLLYRLAGYIGMMSYTQVMFACVRANHVPFYRRLGYHPAGEPKAYPGLSCQMQLLACTRERYDEIRAAFPVIDPLAGSSDALDGFLDGSTVRLSLMNR